MELLCGNEVVLALVFWTLSSQVTCFNIDYELSKNSLFEKTELANNLPSNPQVFQEDEIISHLMKNGGLETNLHRPSTEFMIQLFKDLLHGRQLAEVVGHTDGRRKSGILFSDTIRSFSPEETRRRSLVKFKVPLLPQHEQLRMAEVRFRAGGSEPRTDKFTLLAKKDDVILEKIKFSEPVERSGNNTVLDITRALVSIMNKYHGNVTLELKARKKRHTNRIRRDISADSPQPILVFYSQDKGFLKSVIKSFTNDDIEEDPKLRTKRATKRRRKKNKWGSNKTGDSGDLCKVHDLRVDFDLIGWGPWIIHPKKFNAHVCHGQCPSPISYEYSPTNHAMLQTLMRMKRPLSAPENCCVPTKLKPLSMLYFEYDDIVVRHHQDMIVSECGCR